jgi:hypothetical protein
VAMPGSSISVPRAFSLRFWGGIYFMDGVAGASQN